MPTRTTIGVYLWTKFFSLCKKASNKEHKNKTKKEINKTVGKSVCLEFSKPKQGQKYCQKPTKIL